MSPLRRYLRITRYSVLEVRIYLDNPQDLHRWLLNPREGDVLQRVIQAVRPLVLPKLREENERLKGNKGGGGGGGTGGERKGKKKKGVKDVVVEDDFEVSVFLTNTSTRHAILKKEKRAKDEDAGKRLGTKGGKMTSGTQDAPMEIREESPDEERMEDIPAAKPSTQNSQGEALVVSDTDDDDDDDDDAGEPSAHTTRRKRPAVKAEKSQEEEASRPLAGDDDDKKKMGMNTTYDGFSIYGKILCLVVKRRGGARGRDNRSMGLADSGAGGGQAMMEEWISSTQQQPAGGEGMDD